jgi:hypothetical protein
MVGLLYKLCVESAGDIGLSSGDGREYADGDTGDTAGERKGDGMSRWTGAMPRSPRLGGFGSNPTGNGDATVSEEPRSCENVKRIPVRREDGAAGRRGSCSPKSGRDIVQLTGVCRILFERLN